MNLNLNGTWKLYYYPAETLPVSSPEMLKSLSVPSIPCTVPGNVELDLSAAGGVFSAGVLLNSLKSDTDTDTSSESSGPANTQYDWAQDQAKGQ